MFSNKKGKRRRTKKNNRKETFKKYGKNTSRHVRIVQQQMQNEKKQKKILSQ